MCTLRWDNCVFVAVKGFGLVYLFYILYHVCEQQNKYASVSSIVSISHDCPDNFNNCDANCVPDDTSMIHPPHVFTSVDMEALITQQTGKSLPHAVYLLLHLMIWIRLMFVPPHRGLAFRFFISFLPKGMIMMMTCLFSIFKKFHVSTLGFS